MFNLYAEHKAFHGYGRLFVFLLAVVAFPSFLYSQPTIGSFSPASGHVGTTVTITGSNFSATPSANIVYFGSVKAPVTAASSTSLSVTVPTGTSYQPLTVTTGGLTAFANQPFVTTFPDSDQFRPDAFTQMTNLQPEPGTNPQAVFSADVDGDGKPDLIVVNGTLSSPNTLSIYRNTGTSGTVAFTLQYTYNLQLTDNPTGVTAGDLDGDGKPEIVVTNYGSSTIAIFKNTSTPGTISMAAGVGIYSTGSAANLSFAITTAAIADLNGDGKPEIIVTAGAVDSILYFTNTSPAGGLTFAPCTGIALPPGSYPQGLAIADFDGDGRPDIATADLGTSLVSVLRNTGAIGGPISFATNVDFPAGTFAFSVVAGDLDGDGKPDLAAINNGDGSLSLFWNTSLSGTIGFNVLPVIPSSTVPQAIGIADLDGDGKPELVVVNNDAGTVSVFRNTSTSGTIALATAATYPTGNLPMFVNIADFDGDGKPDLAVSNNFDNTVSIFRNKGSQDVTITSFTPVIGTTGTIITISGYGFTGATAVSFGGTAATYTVVSDSTITATVGTGTSGTVMVTAPAGSASLNGFTFGVLPSPPSITSFTPTSGGSGTNVYIYGHHLTGAVAVLFGGTAANTYIIQSDSVIVGTVGTGSSGKITVTTAIGSDSLGTFTFTPPPPPPPPPPTLDITSFFPASGSTGTAIVIQGKQLSTTTTVTFGGTPAESFSVISDSILIAFVGTGSTGQVLVSSSNGTDSLPGFTFIPPPPPVYKITSFSPTSTGLGSTVTINGVNLEAATAVSFGGTPAVSFIVTSDSTILAVIGSGSTGQVKVTSSTWQDSLAGFTYIKDTTHSGSTTPPVSLFELLQFSGSMSGSEVILKWTARNDNNIAFYEVQRSTDSLQFTTISSIPPTTKNPGNHNYSFTDTDPKNGLNYYQIRIVDSAGVSNYSQVISFHSAPRSKFLTLYPNPAKYGFTYAVVPPTATTSLFQLVAMSGKLVRTQNVPVGTTLAYIDLSGLIEGTYKMIWTDGVTYGFQSLVILK